jgi:oxaloacetate decarboxylase (Na+ extruding) subunit alpha
MKKIKINDITIREIFQNAESQYIDTKSFDIILNHIKDIKYDSIEILGSPGFEKILESNFNLTPIAFISYVKNRIASIPLQILIGARNLGGLEVYSNDIIQRFIKQCVRNGINIFRVYDALNDTGNLKHTISEIINNEASCQGTIIYNNFKDIDFYLKTAKELEKSGCSSICIKDVESTLLPVETDKLFAALGREINIPKFLSTPNLRGLQILNYFEASQKGCDGVDLSFLPSSQTDQNHAVYSFILSLKDEKLTHNLEHSKLIQLDNIIKRYIYPFMKRGFSNSDFIMSSSDKNLLPGWLISSINRQLAEIGEPDSLDSVLEEVFKIKKEMGNPTLATPVGQIIGSQAILNAVISDSRWDILCDEIKKLMRGYYGKLPGKADKKILDKLESTSDNNIESSPSKEVDYEQCKNELINFSDREEDILSYIFYPEKTRKLLEKKKAGLKKSRLSKNYTQDAISENIDIKESKPGLKAKLENLDIKKLREITSLVENSNIEEIKLEVEGVKISINNPRYKIEEPLPSKEEIAEPHKQKSTDLIEVKSPIVGVFYSSQGPDEKPFVKIGNKVKKGDPLCIIEAMKLMNKINSECNGTIIDILALNEDVVEYDQVLIIIKKDKE